MDIFSKKETRKRKTRAISPNVEVLVWGGSQIPVVMEGPDFGVRLHVTTLREDNLNGEVIQSCESRR